MNFDRLLLSCFLLTLVGISGCGTPTPDIISVSGSVTINEKPLSNVRVSFIPLAEGLDGNYIASGITDKQGNFTLSRPGSSEVGCCACKCKVLVKEGPLPDEVYKAYFSNKPKIVERYKASLKNRPIPEIYGKLRTTPLVFDVSTEQSEYALELKR